MKAFGSFTSFYSQHIHEVRFQLILSARKNGAGISFTLTCVYKDRAFINWTVIHKGENFYRYLAIVLRLASISRRCLSSSKIIYIELFLSLFSLDISLIFPLFSFFLDNSPLVRFLTITTSVSCPFLGLNCWIFNLLYVFPFSTGFSIVSNGILSRLFAVKRFPIFCPSNV